MRPPPLPSSDHVLDLYAQQDFDVLVDENQSAGKHSVEFNASGFASGVYIYKLSVNDFVNTKKMVLMK